MALDDRAMWDDWMARAPAYTDRDGLLRYFPTDALQGDDALTAYVLALAVEAGWPIPPDRLETWTAALTRFVEGRIVRRAVP